MSGWTAATVCVSDSELREKIDESMREIWDSDSPDSWGATGYAETTVQVERNADHESVAEELADHWPEADYVTVVSANDTSDSGYGHVYKVHEDGTVEEVDEKNGYEGAKGRDVTGYFSEEWNLRSYASWEA